MIAQEIKGCTLCPLYRNMPLGPLVSEYSGDIYCLFHKIENSCSITDDFVNGVDKRILKRLIPEERWYLSSMNRCITRNNTSATEARRCEKICQSWISKELEEIKPKKLITFGLAPYRYMIARKVSFSIDIFSIQTSPIFGEFLCLPTLYEISNSTEYFNSALKASEEYIGVQKI